MEVSNLDAFSALPQAKRALAAMIPGARGTLACTLEEIGELRKMIAAVIRSVLVG